jgi:hypothetical protein
VTLSEWNRLQALIVTLWPRTESPSHDALKLSLPVVTDVPFEAAQQAVWAWSRQGKEWPPRPGQIVDACRQQSADVLSSGEALDLLRRAAGLFGRERESDALRWLADRSPHLARFVVEHGWRVLCLERIDDPEHGGAVRARLERSYVAVAGDLERERASGHVRELVGQRLRSLGGGQVRSGLRRLDVAQVLGAAGEIEGAA